MIKRQKPTLNKADIDLILEMMRLYFVTHEEFTKFRSDIMDKLDLIIKYTKSTKDELIITQSRVNNHTTRLNRVDEMLNLPAIT